MFQPSRRMRITELLTIHSLRTKKIFKICEKIKDFSMSMIYNGKVAQDDPIPVIFSSQI